MNIVFDGWSRRVYSHEHILERVDHPRTLLGTDPVHLEATRGPAPMFETPRLAYGKLTGLELTGDFLVTLRPSRANLDEWIDVLIDEAPGKAADYLATKLDQAQSRRRPSRD